MYNVLYLLHILLDFYKINMTSNILLTKWYRFVAAVVLAYLDI